MWWATGQVANSGDTIYDAMDGSYDDTPEYTPKKPLSVRIEGVKRKTDKAMLVDLGDGDGFWIPKSWVSHVTSTHLFYHYGFIKRIIKI